MRVLNNSSNCLCPLILLGMHAYLAVVLSLRFFGF